MEKNSGLHVLYKNLGETPLLAIERFKKDAPQYADIPMTYAGRLDPMAEGLLLVVSGEEIKNKDMYLNLNKTYEVQVLWGFETDTLDVLGLVENRNQNVDIGCPHQEQVESLFSECIGKIEQKYPAYSSKPVSGKPLFQWAREGKIGEVEIPSHTVELFEARVVIRRVISKEELLVNIKFKIESVRGDFRQRQIWERWLEVLTQSVKSEFLVDTIQLTVSSGFYVRQFVSDVAKKIGTGAIAFHIKRIAIGDYTIADSLKE